MESLSASGVPVFAVRGAQGGWQLEKGWRTQAPGLDMAELNALLMAQPRTLGHSKLAAAAERAYQELMASLSGPMRAQAEAIRERLYVDASGWRPSTEDLSELIAVQAAVASDRTASFDYTRADGESGPRTVDPLGACRQGSELVSGGAFAGRAANLSRLAHEELHRSGDGVQASAALQSGCVLARINGAVCAAAPSVRGCVGAQGKRGTPCNRVVAR